ncbi:probable cytochrome P450 4ac1 [Panonychus citri]|uniref:probable cytochrome P450 4ac1 n=1 Tax=Panonychus citri TaxID=50023 RepID=UPI00230739E3|nr:probable cytochrome P450 4ac1 [Panonychus citri]
MLTITWILLTIILIYLIKLIIDYRNWMRHFYKYPSYSVTISDVLVYFSGPEAVIKKWGSRSFFRRALQLTKNDDYFVIWLAFIPVLFIKNPNLAEKAFKAHNIKTIFMSAVLPVIRNGIFMMSDEKKWKIFRKISEINLKTKMLQKFFPIMSHHCDKMVDKLYKLEEGQWSDFNDEVGLTTFNVICESGMGISTESPKLESTALRLFEVTLQFPKHIVLRAFNPLLWPEFTWTRYLDYMSDGQSKVLEKLFKYVVKREVTRQLGFKSEGETTISKDDDSLKRSVSDNAQNNNTIDEKDDIDLIKPNCIENNFLSKVVDIYVNQNVTNQVNHENLISADEVESEINNFVLAGFETVRTGILFTLACIASEPIIQQRIYDELVEVFGDPQEKWTFDLEKLNQLHFTDCCVREGLRIFAPQQLLGRNSGSEKFQLDEDHLLPPRTEYLISVYSIHHNEKIYPEPEKYDPDRWSPGRVEKIPFNCWIPFGVGPRACVGYRYAIYEMIMVISSIVKHFHLYSNRHYDDINWSFVLTTRPIEELKFKVKPRNKSN